MALDERQMAASIVAEVARVQGAAATADFAATAARSRSTAATLDTATALAGPTGGEFCAIWQKAKPILELLAGIAILIPGAGATAGAVLQALIKIGDQLSSQLCGT